MVTVALPLEAVALALAIEAVPVAVQPVARHVWLGVGDGEGVGVVVRAVVCHFYFYFSVWWCFVAGWEGWGFIRLTAEKATEGEG